MNFAEWKELHKLSGRTDTIGYVWDGVWNGLDGSETPGKLYGRVNLGTGEYTANTFLPYDGEEFDPGETTEMDWADVTPGEATEPKWVIVSE